jgi:hypothetical protein
MEKILVLTSGKFIEALGIGIGTQIALFFEINFHF